MAGEVRVALVNHLVVADQGRSLDRAEVVTRTQRVGNHSALVAGLAGVRADGRDFDRMLRGVELAAVQRVGTGTPVDAGVHARFVDRTAVVVHVGQRLGTKEIVTVVRRDDHFEFLVRREADGQQPVVLLVATRAQAVHFVRVGSFRLVMRHDQASGEHAWLDRDAQRGFRGAAARTRNTTGDAGLKRVERLFRHVVDHARIGVAAVQRADGALDDLDPLQVHQAQADGRAVRLVNAVDEDRHVRIVGAAAQVGQAADGDVDVGLGAGRIHGQAGRELGDVKQVLHAGVFELFAGDRRDGERHVLQPFRAPARGHGHRLQRGGRRLPGAGGRRSRAIRRGRIRRGLRKHRRDHTDIAQSHARGNDPTAGGPAPATRNFAMLDVRLHE